MRKVSVGQVTGTCQYCERGGVLLAVPTYTSFITFKGDMLCRECILLMLAAVDDTNVESLTNGYVFDGSLPDRRRP